MPRGDAVGALGLQAGEVQRAVEQRVVRRDDDLLRRVTRARARSRTVQASRRRRSTRGSARTRRSRRRRPPRRGPARSGPGGAGAGRRGAPRAAVRRSGRSTSSTSIAGRPGLLRGLGLLLDRCALVLGGGVGERRPRARGRSRCPPRRRVRATSSTAGAARDRVGGGASASWRAADLAVDVACSALTFAVVLPVTPLPTRRASSTATRAPSRLSSRAVGQPGDAAADDGDVDLEVARRARGRSVSGAVCSQRDCAAVVVVTRLPWQMCTSSA